MNKFSDIFIINILGLLHLRQFTGSAYFQIKNQVIILGYKRGIITRIWNSDVGLANLETFYWILWTTEGEITLKPSVIPIPPAFNYYEELEKALHQPPEDFPFDNMGMNLGGMVHTSPIAFQKSFNNNFETMSKNILTTVRAAQPLKGLVMKYDNSLEFWQALLFLFGTGQIALDYQTRFYQMLKKLEETLSGCVSKLLGGHMTKNYLQKIEAATIDIPRYENAFDPIHGSAPYKIWAKELQNNISTIKPPSLAKRAYQTAIQNLTEKEQLLFEYLIK